MRVDIENLLSELHLDEKQVGRILEVLDKHASFDRIDDDDPNAMRARELAGDDQLENFRALLVAASISEADIDERCASRTAARSADWGPTPPPERRASKSATPTLPGSFHSPHPRGEKS